MVPIFHIINSYLTKQRNFATDDAVIAERNGLARQLAYTLGAHEMKIRHS